MTMVMLFISSQSDIVKELHRYDFCKLNATHNLYEMNEEFLNGIGIPTLCAEPKQILDQPSSKKELYYSLISMKQNKSPGDDGFPVEFYIVFGRIFLNFC